MKFDGNLASIHAYLCADGYVIKNPETQRHKYYRIGFRNTNLALLKDFQHKFEKVFKIKPRLIEGERCELGSREIYEKITKKFGDFHSKEWKMPQLNKGLSKVWIRAFFDCESWVFCKSHQNRHIGLDTVNEKGLNQIIKALNNLGIKTIKKINGKRRMFRIFIYGKENLKKFQQNISFSHPEKLEKLNITLKNFIDYNWHVDKSNIVEIIKEKARIKKPHYIRIISKENINLEEIKKLLKDLYNIECSIYERINGIGTLYYELNINKKDYIKKLIELKIVPDVLKNGIQK